MAHVSQAKKDAVKQLLDQINSHSIVAAVNMENIPARTVQKMREQLRKNSTILMSKRRLIKVALEQAKDSKQGIEKLGEHLKGMPALLFTNDNPFTLYKTLQKNKSNAPAKAGQTAPKDIVVPAGPTSFAPGPVIGELGSIGVKAGIDAGKVVIKQDSIVAKEGDILSDKVAGLLTRLGIEPMEIGLDLTAAYEDGMIFEKSILSVDEQQYIDNITNCSRWAMNLAIDVAYPTADTMTVLVTKSFSDAKALCISQSIVNSVTVGDLLSKAYAQMVALGHALPDDAKSDELKALASAAPVASAASTSTEKKPEDDKKEEPKEENAAAGLGALFG